jgi:hypothetical protein
MLWLLFAVAGLYVILNQYLFRFQRVTRSLARSVFSGADQVNGQIIMTPTWVGMLGWMLLPFNAAIAIGFIWLVGWTAGLIWLTYAFLGVALVNWVTPLPSYEHCFELVESSVRGDDSVTPEQRLAMLEKIEIARREAFAPTALG